MAVKLIFASILILVNCYNQNSDWNNWKEIVLIYKNDTPVCGGFLVCENAIEVPRNCIDNTTYRVGDEHSDPYTVQIINESERYTLTGQGADEEEQFNAVYFLKKPYCQATNIANKIIFVSSILFTTNFHRL